MFIAASRLPVPKDSLQLPNEQILSKALNVAFKDYKSNSLVSVVRREWNRRESSFPSEIVTVGFDDGSELSVFCKYAAPFDAAVHDEGPTAGGVAYEASVYSRLLKTSTLPVPRFYGAYVDAADGFVALFIENLKDALKVSKDPTVMVPAAQWAGEFHRLHEADIGVANLGWLAKHTPAYYRFWVRRAAEFVRSSGDPSEWFQTLCNNFEKTAIPLLMQRQTIVHGEYYPSNVQLTEGKIKPVDWESAAIGVGEIDLACLLDAWDEDVIRQCEMEYRRVRWPADSPADFHQTLAAAKLYVQFRAMCSERELAYVPLMREPGERLGII